MKQKDNTAGKGDTVASLRTEIRELIGEDSEEKPLRREEIRQIISQFKGHDLNERSMKKLQDILARELGEDHIAHPFPKGTLLSIRDRL